MDSASGLSQTRLEDLLTKARIPSVGKRQRSSDSLKTGSDHLVALCNQTQTDTYPFEFLLIRVITDMQCPLSPLFLLLPRHLEEEENLLNNSEAVALDKRMMDGVAMEHLVAGGRKK